MPVLERVQLESFSLYAHRPNLDLVLQPGVFCVAGANGLGKSTFLNTITYALTGVVPDPADRFDSIDEHYRHNLAYARRYFAGRISEEDRPAAAVGVMFRLGPRRYSLTRPLFDQEALRELVIEGEESVDGAELFSDDERHALYVRSVVTDMGLATFQQYVFLHHFAFTFDERRHLLFWNEKLLGSALYLAFGVSPEEAERAEALRRAAERADSQARNLQYQVTTARRRLDEIKRAASQPASDEPVGEYDRLVEARGRAQTIRDKTAADVEDARLALSRARALVLGTRADYDSALAKRFEHAANASEHPLVLDVIEDQFCGICGSRGQSVARTVETALASALCPLCGSAIDPVPVEKSFSEIAEIADRLEHAEEAALEADNAVRRLGDELIAAETTLSEAAKAVRQFERENERAVVSASQAGVGLEAVRQSVQAEIDNALGRKEDFRRERDRARRELRSIQAGLNAAYRDAERDFVPVFTSLARSFLGIDLDVQLELRSTGEVGLLLTVGNTRRRAEDQLSESQRFFIDIALRMALAQHRASSNGGATLYIDTPEGSLDVAYEARAGEMFADFVEAGNDLVMTANLSSSQLLTHLASRCGHDKMDLIRMIDWTPLSDVQSDAEQLFEDAYVAVENLLGKTHV
jgi:DNA repair exonuclease SbcCD ATPase subunit